MKNHLSIRIRPDSGAEKLARKIKQLAPSLSCLGCGNRDFALVEEPASGFRSYFERQDTFGGSPITAQHLVASVICMKCGYVAQFSDGILLEDVHPDVWGSDVDSEDVQ